MTKTTETTETTDTSIEELYTLPSDFNPDETYKKLLATGWKDGISDELLHKAACDSLLAINHITRAIMTMQQDFAQLVMAITVVDEQTPQIILPGDAD